MAVHAPLTPCSPGLYKQLSILRDLLSDARGDPSTVSALKEAIAGEMNTWAAVCTAFAGCSVLIVQLITARSIIHMCNTHALPLVPHNQGYICGAVAAGNSKAHLIYLVLKYLLRHPACVVINPQAMLRHQVFSLTVH